MFLAVPWKKSIACDEEWSVVLLTVANRGSISPVARQTT